MIRGIKDYSAGSEAVTVVVSFWKTVDKFVGHHPAMLTMRAVELERAAEVPVSVVTLKEWQSGADAPPPAVRRRVVAFILREAGFEAT